MLLLIASEIHNFRAQRKANNRLRANGGSDLANSADNTSTQRRDRG